MTAADYRSGDLVFCHGTGIIAAAIRLAQRLRSNAVTDYRWNHVATLVAPSSDGMDWHVVTDAGAGVVLSTLSELAPDGYYEVVRCPARAPALSLAFATSQAGRRYGYLTIASILVNLLTPRFISFRREGTWVCSALATGALWYGGWTGATSLEDVYQVAPAELYRDITGAEAPPVDAVTVARFSDVRAEAAAIADPEALL